MFTPRIISFLCYVAIVLAIFILVTACSSPKNSSGLNWQKTSVTNKSCNRDPHSNGGATYGFPQRLFSSC